uniref:Uncharacterized protein n=1 Tax=Anguilla anguilla TaxID=7936 RepID=A0A0E9WBC7_ANGAN
MVETGHYVMDVCLVCAPKVTRWKRIPCSEIVGLQPNFQTQEVMTSYAISASKSNIFSCPH